MRILKTSQKMGIAAAIMAASILLSRFMGLFRDKVISYYYGAGTESDIYFASFVVPDFINYLLAGGYFSITLIPLLSEYFEKDEPDGWRFFSTVLTWCTVAIGALTALAMLFAPQLAQLAAPGFAPEATARLAYFLRIILPAQVFFLTGSCLTALLYYRKQFFVPALTPLVYNGCIIAGGLLFIEKGMEGFCWGVLVGSFLGNFLLPLLAATGSGLRYGLSFAHAGLKRFVLLALPLMVGQSVVVLDEQLLRVFGSMATEGAVSWLNYARRIMLVPVGVVAQAAGVASYPFLATLAAKGEKEQFDKTLSSAFCGTAVFIVPIALWMIIVAEPTIRLIFQQGEFTAAATAETSLCLRVMLAVVFCWGIQQIAGRAFYANKDTLTPAVVGTLVSVGSVPLYMLLVSRYGALGIAISSSASVALYTLALSLVWRRKHGAGGFTGMGKALGVSFLISCVAALPALAVVRSAPYILPDSPLLNAFVVLLCSGLLFCITFYISGAWLARETLQPIFVTTDNILKKLRIK